MILQNKKKTKQNKNHRSSLWCIMLIHTTVLSHLVVWHMIVTRTSILYANYQCIITRLFTVTCCSTLTVFLSFSFLSVQNNEHAETKKTWNQSAAHSEQIFIILDFFPFRNTLSLKTWLRLQNDPPGHSNIPFFHTYNSCFYTPVHSNNLPCMSKFWRSSIQTIDQEILFASKINSKM